VRRQLHEKEENCKNIEAEIVSLIKELKKTVDQLNIILKFGKSNEILDNILILQRSPLIKISLGYNKNKRTPREMQVLRSQSHKERKMRKNLKVMPIFSKSP